MQLFRIVKIAEEAYRLLRKLPEDKEHLFGKDAWDVVKDGLKTPLEARQFAHDKFSKNGDTVEEFSI